LREIVGGILVLNTNLRAGADLDQALGGQPVGAIGIEPDAALECERIVLDHDGGAVGELGAIAADSMIIIELRAAHADGDVEVAGPGFDSGSNSGKFGGRSGDRACLL